MTLPASSTIPGKQYRRARDATDSSGMVYVRSLLEADKHVRKLRLKGQANLTAQEAFLVATYLRDSTQILMRRHLIGTDPQSKEGYRYQSLVFVPADYLLIEVGNAPEGVEVA